MTRYRVTSSIGWAGYQAGDEFDADLAPDVERRALDQDSIEVVKSTKKPDKTKPEEEGGTDA